MKSRIIKVMMIQPISLRFIDVSRLFFYVFVWVLPLQIKTLIAHQAMYESGFFNPYLNHFLYVGDVLLILMLLFLGLHLVFKKENEENGFVHGNTKLTIIIGVFLVMYIFSLLVSVDKVNSFCYLVRYFEFFVIYLLISHGFVKIKNTVYVFLGSMTFVAFIGILQYVFQQSIGLAFLGEPVVTATTLGAAKVALFDTTVLRAYGTFPHPNLFAGYLVFAILFSVYYWRRHKRLFTPLLVVFGAGLILTFSRSAILALAAGMIVYYLLSGMKLSMKYLLLGLSVLLLFVAFFDLTSIISYRFIIGDENSLHERGILYMVGKRIFFDNWFGVGAGNFTSVMQGYVENKLFPWQFQPVHNIFVLVLNELGFWGVTAFVLIFVCLARFLLDEINKFGVDKKFLSLLLALLLVIFVIGIFDHYFVSLYQGQALFWIFLGIAGKMANDKKSVL